MPRPPLTLVGIACALLSAACPVPLASPPAPAAATSAPAAPTAAPTPQHDLPLLERGPERARYDMKAMGNPGFDGAASDSWIHRADQLCRGQALRPIIVDIDHTAVHGNFVREVEVDAQARAILAALDRRHGVLFLTANFAIDRIRAFFDRTDYPAAPIVARPRNYWQRDYDDWCKQASHYAICETEFKLDSIEQLRTRCAERPARMVGLGDKFSDYAAYLRAGVCPLILRGGKVDKANAEARARGCTLDRDGQNAWPSKGEALGERCALVPEPYLVRWDQVEGIVDSLLSGQVECGAWGEGTTP